MELNYHSVETIANLNASAAFQVDSGKMFKDDVDICQVIIDKKLLYHILDLIESDDLKHFVFCVSVIILNAEGIIVVKLIRKEVCYCRLSPAEKKYLLFF